MDSISKISIHKSIRDGDALYHCKARKFRTGEITYIVVAHTIGVISTIGRGGNAGFPIKREFQGNVKGGCEVGRYTILDVVPLNSFIIPSL